MTDLRTQRAILDLEQEVARCRHRAASGSYTPSGTWQLELKAQQLEQRIAAMKQRLLGGK